MRREGLDISLRFNQGEDISTSDPALQYDKEECRICDTRIVTYKAIDYTAEADEISYGILYELDGDTLTLNPSIEVPGVFTRD